MTAKRNGFLLVLAPLFILLLLSACTGQGAVSGENSASSHPFPMWLEVPAEENLECPEHVQLQYAGCNFDVSSAEGEQIALQIECTLTQPMPEWTNFFILYQADENSKWHVVFDTTYAVQSGPFDPPGTETFNCAVPRNLFSHKGAYKIGFPDRGTCDLPREDLWNGPDEEFGGPDGFPTESGFPMYRDSRLAGPPEASPNTELTAAELVEGDGTDILKLTANVQDNTFADHGNYHILFRSPKDDRLYIVFRPVEGFLYEASEQTSYDELDPGVHTLEYPVPKRLFRQEGEYYIVCVLGGFRLLGN